MQAVTMNFSQILDGRIRYIVPHFQRFYVWGDKEWQKLWDDIANLLDPTGAPKHFIGPMVARQVEIIPSSDYPSFELIDGQQRMITLYILLSVIRDIAFEQSDDRLAEEIQDTFITNKHGEDLDYYKLLPRTLDRDALVSIVDRKKIPGISRIAKAQRFFLKKISDLNPEEYEHITTSLPRAIYSSLIKRLSTVYITVESQDNPFVIFESLNHPGLQLEEADLIRNFIFSNMDFDKQEKFDNDTWKPFEDRLPKDKERKPDGKKITLFYRHYIMVKKANQAQKLAEAFVRTREVFVSFQKFYKDHSLTPFNLVKDMNHYADLYYKIVGGRNPENFADKFEIYQSLGNTTVYPLILYWFDKFTQEIISEKEFKDVLVYIQSFIIRRAIIQARTKGYDEMFAEAIIEAKTPIELYAFLHEFDSNGWPTDDLVLESLVKFPFYSSFKSKPTKMILGEIERSFGHKEIVNINSRQLTVEHIMPQTPSPEWITYLEDEYDSYGQFVHTLGNLTLTGYNSELSNALFEDKIELYNSSHFMMTKELVNHEFWNIDNIKIRTEKLGKILLTIWPRYE